MMILRVPAVFRFMFAYMQRRVCTYLISKPVTGNTSEENVETTAGYLPDLLHFAMV